MAYTRHNWQCGQTITAELMNNLEDGVEEALQCCESTDVGYECSEGWVTLTEESVTTEQVDNFASAPLSYLEPIGADTIKVTFDGTEYTCQRDEFGVYGAYWSDETAAYDWTQYPFSIAYSGVNNELATETVGTYQVKIETFEEIVETSECFEKAVKKISGVFYIDATIGLSPITNYQTGWNYITETIPNVSIDKSYAEIKEAYESGQQCVMREGSSRLLRMTIAPALQGERYIFEDTRVSIGYIYISGARCELRAITTNQITVAPDDSVTYTRYIIANAETSGN